MKSVLKSIYRAIPFKQQIYVLVRSVWRPPQRLYRHLHFVGTMKIKVDEQHSFRMRHYGYLIENEIFWNGIMNSWEKNSLRIWKKLVERCDVIVDVGANTGVYSLLAKSINPGATAILVSPDGKRLFVSTSEGSVKIIDARTGQLLLTLSGRSPLNCLTLNPAGDISGVTTTSGLAFKIPGRVGDSPIIGAGLYVDNDVGAAGATGRGEAVIISGGSRIVVENMRHGLTPRDAVLDVLERIAHQTVDPRLRDDKGRPDFNVTFYALRKDGVYASGSLWKGKKFAINSEGRNRLEECGYLYEK